MRDLSPTTTRIPISSEEAGTMDGCSSAPTVKSMCAFLSRYSARMLACGATCIRLEMNIKRMAAAYGMDVEVTIMPRHVHVSVYDGDGRTATVIAGVCSAPISFNVNTRLSELSWEVADGKTDFDAAVKRYDEIVGEDGQKGWLVLLLAAVANASFCRLFGGDAVAMAVVFVATAVGYRLKQLLVGCKVDVRVVVALCAFVSTVLGATDSLFGLGSTPGIAIGSSVLYLVPGIPFLNSFSDMLYRHYICAFGRFMDAVVLTACLSAGMCAGLLLMGVGMF